jgi:hypothetical protein
MTWTVDDGKVVREMIVKEAELINHRFTWLATLQGLLLAALGFAWKDAKELVLCLVVLGVGSSISSLAILWRSQEAIKGLKQQWDRNKPQDYSGPDVIGFIPNIRRFELVLPWLFLPVLFIAAWLAVLMIHLLRHA